MSDIRISAVLHIQSTNMYDLISLHVFMGQTKLYEYYEQKWSVPVH